MTEIPGGGVPEGDSSSQESPVVDWQTQPHQVNDISQIPVHKMQEAFDKRGTQVEMQEPTHDGKIPAQVNRLVLKDVPKRLWYWPPSWFKK